MAQRLRLSFLKRILFVAHREGSLGQALKRTGHIIAIVAKIGFGQRPRHLERNPLLPNQRIL